MVYIFEDDMLNFYSLWLFVVTKIVTKNNSHWLMQCSLKYSKVIQSNNSQRLRENIFICNKEIYLI